MKVYVVMAYQGFNNPNCYPSAVLTDKTKAEALAHEQHGYTEEFELDATSAAAQTEGPAD